MKTRARQLQVSIMKYGRSYNLEKLPSVSGFMILRKRLRTINVTVNDSKLAYLLTKVPFILSRIVPTGIRNVFAK